MGALKVGDVIYDDQGKPCYVTAATEVMHGHECFELEFDSGARIIADANHRWHTFTAPERHREAKASPEFREHRQKTRPDSKRTGRRRSCVYEPPPFVGAIRPTTEIAKTVRWGAKRQEANHAIRVMPTLETQEQALPIPPYVLGVWLGDGTTATGTVTGIDMEIFERLTALGFSSHRMPSTAMGYRIEGFTKTLRLNGLLHNKHIPAPYLRASREQRLELLKGLMDTDGSATQAGGVEFVNTNQNLAQGVVELARSLGHKVTLRPGLARLNGRVIGPMWRATWTPPEYVFHLTRKLKAQRLGFRPTLKWHYITKCTPVASVPVRCISVSSPSRLFLASEHMIPTHNSNACMLVASQWLNTGRQLIVLDAHGEYSALWGMNPTKIQRIGYGDEPVNEGSVDWVMDFVRDGYSVLIDFSHWADVDPKKLDAFVREFMLALYAWRRQKPAQTMVMVEECQSFIPQMQSTGQSDNVKAFVAMLTGGRKFGLNFILSSQRQSLVDVNAVSGCNLSIYMRISAASDWKRMKQYLPEKFPLNFGSKTKKDVRKFQSGEAVVLSRWFDASRFRLPLPEVAVTKFLTDD